MNTLLVDVGYMVSLSYLSTPYGDGANTYSGGHSYPNANANARTVDVEITQLN